MAWAPRSTQLNGLPGKAPEEVKAFSVILKTEAIQWLIRVKKMGASIIDPVCIQVQKGVLHLLCRHYKILQENIGELLEMERLGHINVGSKSES